MIFSPKFVSFFLSFFPLLFVAQSSTSCSEDFTELTQKQNITRCKNLNTLGAEFGWNYSPNKSRINILFGVKDKDLTWLAWGINPGKLPEMVGTRAIIGIKQANGSFSVRTYNITSNTKIGCPLLPVAKIDVEVLNMKGEFSNTSGFTTISATVVLSQAYNASKLNHVWQVGYAADTESSQPSGHPRSLQNFDSAETINLASGTSHSVGHHRHHLRVVHGILNIVGWGVLLPVGVIIARYFRKFPFKRQRWYALHVGCQIVGYTLGTTGWAIGLWLGHASRHYSFQIHRLVAIFIFAFTTLQMLALRLRPKPNDDYRKYWDMYHHFLGYALLALISFNIFKGIAILKPDHTWKWAYIGVLAALGLITLILEIWTWAKFFKDKDKESKPTSKNDKKDQESAGSPA